MSKAESRGGAAKGFGDHDAGQMQQVGERGGGAGLDEMHGDVLPLGLIPLEPE